MYMCNFQGIFIVVLIELLSTFDLISYPITSRALLLSHSSFTPHHTMRHTTPHHTTQHLLLTTHTTPHHRELIDERGGDLNPDENLLEVWVKSANIKEVYLYIHIHIHIHISVLRAHIHLGIIMHASYHYQLSTPFSD